MCHAVSYRTDLVMGLSRYYENDFEIKRFDCEKLKKKKTDYENLQITMDLDKSIQNLSQGSHLIRLKQSVYPSCFTNVSTLSSNDCLCNS